MTDKTPETEPHDEDTSGLKAKNADLLKKLKAAEKRAEAAEAAKEDAAEEAKNASADDLTKAQTRITRLERDLEAANKRADSAESGLKTYKAETEIAKAIAANNVNSEDVRAVTALFKMDMEMDDDGNPTIEGKPLADYAKSYFAKDGLKYVRAADNSGGGALGNDGTKPSQYNIKSAADITPELMKLATTNPAEYNAIVTNAGLSELKV